MAQGECWLFRCNEVMGFMVRKGWNSSRRRIEENWLKANRKVLKAGKMKEEREELIEKLMEMGVKVWRKN